MWMTADSGWFKAGDVNNGTLNWKEALAWCENLSFAGHDDWRLPNAKMDVHGAGSQRGDLRDGNRENFTFHDGPQSDEMRTYNFAHAVRSIK